MNDVVPTLEDLNRKATAELCMIFRKACERAGSPTLTDRQRTVARQTVAMVLQALRTKLRLDIP